MSMIKKGNFPQMSDQDQLAMAGASEEGKGGELFQTQWNPFYVELPIQGPRIYKFQKVSLSYLSVSLSIAEVERMRKQMEEEMAINVSTTIIII